ncbi:MAG: PIN domain-containing protein [Eggerthellaceae bacterium]|nr:PIN domain-containing protein [Eggerthellaceae bacterium]
MRLIVDTNIIIDFLARRSPFDESARKLLVLASLGEFELWMSSSQVTDVFFIMTSGPRESRLSSDAAKEALRKLRKAVRICSLSENDVDAVLDSPWGDFEDACVHRAALRVKADALVTRNKKDYTRSSVKVLDFDDLFAYLEREKGLAYEEISW